MRIYISAISSVVVGLILSVSGGTATPNDDESTDYFQQQYDQSGIEQHHHQQQHHPMLRHEPPAWAAATYSNDGVGRRLQDVCVPGTNPYSSTTIASGIGTGSPGVGSCTSLGNPCNSQNNGGDRCVFPQCNGDGIAEDVWDKKFDNWSGTTTADYPAYTENIDDGTYTYFFTVTSSDVGSSISYVMAAFEDGCCLEGFYLADGTDAASPNVVECDSKTCVTGVKDNNGYAKNEVRSYKMTFSGVTSPTGGNIAVVLKAGPCVNCVTYLVGPSCTVPSSDPSSGPSAEPSTSVLQIAADPVPVPVPSSGPSASPSTEPSAIPSSGPSILPTNDTSVQPSTGPSTIPTHAPSVQPSTEPSVVPSIEPSSEASSNPSLQPSTSPTTVPSVAPSLAYSTSPSSAPSPETTNGVVEIRYEASITVENMNISSVPTPGDALDKLIDVLTTSIGQFLPENTEVQIISIGGISVTDATSSDGRMRRYRLLQADAGVEIEFEVVSTLECDDAECTDADAMSSEAYETMTQDMAQAVDSGELTNEIQEEAAAANVVALESIAIDSFEAQLPAGFSAVPSSGPSAFPSELPSTSLNPSSLPSLTPSNPPTVSPCYLNPCRNGGTCTDTVGANDVGYECQCTESFEGATCGIYKGETTTLEEAQEATKGAESVLEQYFDAAWNYKVAEHDLEVVTKECTDANVTYVAFQALATELTSNYDQVILHANKMEQELNLAISRSSTPAEKGRLRYEAEDVWTVATEDEAAALASMNDAVAARDSAESDMNQACDGVGNAESTFSLADSTYGAARSDVESEPLLSGRSTGFRSLSDTSPLINPATLDFVYNDMDGDLIVDRFDACPTQRGLRRDSPSNPGPQDFCPSGCPELLDSDGNPIDTDGDLVPDCEDRCPYDFGIDYNHGWTNGALPTGADRDPNLDFKGCPDRDDDGIPDILDACPDQAGGSCYSGCPNSKGADYDTDRDGIVDCLDRCPNTYAVGTLDGCRDRDFDGVPDSRDYCMTTPGSASFTFQRSVEGNAEKALTIVGCPDTDGDLVPDPADLCNAPAYPNQGLTVDGIVQSGDAVVDKSGCPTDSDKDGVFDGIDACDGTDYSPAGTEHDSQAIVFSPEDDDATDENLGCPRDTDNDGIVDGIDQCPAEGGFIGDDGCPIDNDRDQVRDCVSTDPNADCHSRTSLPNAACCIERDFCTGTPRGATVNSTGCPSDADGDGVWDGIDMCPYTTQAEVALANSDPSKMTIDMKGCAIMSEFMWDPIFVDVTTVDANGADPGIELMFAVDANLPLILESRQYNVATEMIEVRIKDGSCVNTFDDQTLDVAEKILPLTVTVNNADPAFTGQIPLGSLPITVDVDLIPDNTVGSPIWKMEPPYEQGNIDFCLSFAILSDILEPVTFMDLKASIIVDMSQGFSVVETAVQRAKPEVTTELIDIEYPLNACQCDASNTCVADSVLDDSFLTQSDSLKLCISFAEDGSLLPPKYVQMVDVSTLTCNQGGLSITPILNYERQGSGGQLTAVNVINNMSDGQNYGRNDRMIIVDTRLPAYFFGREKRPVDCAGTIVYDFTEGSPIGGPIAVGDRRLRPSANTSVSPISTGQRKAEAAAGESQSQFSIQIMLAKASGDGKDNSDGLVAGLTVSAATIISILMVFATAKMRRGASICLGKKDDSSDCPAGAAPEISSKRRQRVVACVVCTDDRSVSTFADSTSGSPSSPPGWVA